MSPAQRLDTIVCDAGELLALVDGAATAFSDSRKEEEDDDDAAVLVGPGIGSVARIVAARDAVRSLEEELQVETERRVRLERMLGRAEVDEDGRVVPPKPPTPSSAASKSPSVPIEAVLEVGKVMVDVATSPIFPSPSQTSVQEDSASSLEPSLADLPAVSSETNSTAVEHISTAPCIVHQPTPRSTIGSPPFLSPRSSPSSSPVSTLANTHSTLPASSLSLQDNATSSESQADTTRSSSPPASSSQRFSSLLAELGKTKTRYDEIQRAFRDCHLALRELSQTLPAIPPSSSSLPTSALQTILARLDDFKEDARVELEIRIADEERIARGYATLLAVPGAIASAEEAQEVERAVRAFVEGSSDDETVARARNRFARKREDLEHDVAALKRAVHELPQQTEAPSSPLPSPSPSPLRPATPVVVAANSSSWTSLAAGLFASGSGSSRPASPSPMFGAVVTSPRPRRTISSSSVAAEAPGPLVALQQQLRIPMPELHHHHHHQVQAGTWPSSVRPGSKARTRSGMYMLGLGMRGGVGVPGESRKVSVEAAAGDCEVE